jgi:NAD(P)-dependent dehydrogenase (short-subunit alcohol dehydrogenase family)
MAAHLFIEQGHGIVLHARNQKRGREALAAVLGAEKVGGGDLSGVAQTRNVAEQVNALSSFGAVIGCSLHAPEPGWVATKMGGVGAPDDRGRRTSQVLGCG